MDRARELLAEARLSCSDLFGDRCAETTAIHAIAAALSLPRSEEWREIASAPKDGSLFDVWVPSYAEPGKGYRVSDLHMSREGTLYRRHDPQPVDLAHWPTYWRPLPAPPALSTGGGE